MGVNALTDVSWVATTEGYLSPREALLHASEISGLDLSLPGYTVSATLRTLLPLLALTARELGVHRVGLSPLSADAVDSSLGAVAAGSDLHDTHQPFMQRPPVLDNGTSETTLAPGNQPVRKLDPTVPPNQALDFWHLSAPSAERLPLEVAVPALVVFNYFSMAGNNSYAGEKCAWGAPGIRFPGKDRSATEVCWLGGSLLETLAMNTPRSWVEGLGLPAWADRTCQQSRDGVGEHPLWRATWSSNAAAGLWEGEELVAVRVGGIPQDWYVPSQGQTKESRKAWWDARDTEDPLYLYATDKNGQLKAQRVDIGRDATELAVQWNADGNPRRVREKLADRLLEHVEDSRILFFRHRVEGTATSASIRASEALPEDPSRWAPSLDAADALQVHAQLVNQLHWHVTKPFRRMSAADKKFAAAGGAPAVIESLAARRPDASTYFWRAMAPVFDGLVDAAAAGRDPDDAIWALASRASMAAFDEAVSPFYGQGPAVIEYVRGVVKTAVNREIGKTMQGYANASEAS